MACGGCGVPGPGRLTWGVKGGREKRHESLTPQPPSRPPAPAPAPRPLLPHHEPAAAGRERKKGDAVQQCEHPRQHAGRHVGSLVHGHHFGRLHSILGLTGRRVCRFLLLYVVVSIGIISKAGFNLPGYCLAPSFPGSWSSLMGQLMSFLCSGHVLRAGHVF